MERYLPAHAGAVILDLKLGLLDAGCKIMNHDSVVMSLAHLYKALRAANLLNRDWTDMDFVLSMFKGAARKPLLAKVGPAYDEPTALRHYNLDLGTPVIAFARDSRRMPVPSDKDSLKFTVTSPFLKDMCDRESQWEAHGFRYSKCKKVEKVLYALAAASPQARNDTKIPGKKHRFAPLQLLSTYRSTLLKEEATLNFDFVGFTLACMRLMRSIEELTPNSRAMEGQATTKDDYVFTTSYFLNRLNNGTAAAGLVSLFENFLEGNARTFQQQAFDQSSGRIPKSLRPKIGQDEASRRELLELGTILIQCTSTPFMLSGYSVAAYHPMIRFACGSGCCTIPIPEPEEVTETRIEHFDATLPACIFREATDNIKNRPRKVLIVVQRLLKKVFKAYTLGHIDENRLCSELFAMLNSDLEPYEDAQSPELAWSLSMSPDAIMYDVFFWQVMVPYRNASTKSYGEPIAVPLEAVYEAAAEYEKDHEN